MRREDWLALGEAIRANADLLESIVHADEEGVPLPETMPARMSWLVSHHLVDEFEGQLHPSSLLLDIGARIASLRFELSAPDLAELFIKIEQGCERFHSAKELSPADLDREHRQIWLAARQIVTHLRDEQRAANEFIEARYGFSPRFEDRLRDIGNAIDRLKRLAMKLELADHNALSSWCRGDRALRRLLLQNLHGSVLKQGAVLQDLIDRLDQIGMSVRQRSRLRQVAQSLASWIQAGNSLDLEGLLERPDGTKWVPAEKLPVKGYLFPHVEDAKAMDDMAQLVYGLPLPKVRRAADDSQASRAPVRVLRSALEIEDAPIPFAQPHFVKMMGSLKETLEPQSASVYWARAADIGCGEAVWLYALDSYYRSILADAGRAGETPRFILEPIDQPSGEGFDNLVVADLVLRRRKRGEPL